jgi:hypothetical protein
MNTLSNKIREIRYFVSRANDTRNGADLETKHFSSKVEARKWGKTCAVYRIRDLAKNRQIIEGNF